MKKKRTVPMMLIAALMFLTAAFGPAAKTRAEDMAGIGEAQDWEEEAGTLSDLNEAVLAETVSPSKSAAKITGCGGYKAGQIRITAKVTKPVKSLDNYYYLFRVNSSSAKLETNVAKQEKAESGNQRLTFTLDTEGHPEYVMSRYALAVKTKKGSRASCYTRISSPQFVKQPEKASTNSASYELGKTKKGLQSAIFSEITDTKSSNAFINMYASTVVDGGAVPYVYNGKTYYFNAISAYQGYVSSCNRKGIPVTMQLMLDWTDGTKSMIAAKSKGSSSSFYAWNTADKAAKQKVEALFSYLAEMFSKEGCYVTNWILGNEVNSSGYYHYMGNVTKSEFVANYAESFRCLYNAVRSKKASSRVFICVDHLWNTTAQGYAAKDVIDSFAAMIKKLQKNVEWNLAYHAYPAPLTDCRFWQPNSWVTNSVSSKIVNLQNLSVMTDYIKSTYGSNTRVILSEQGFTSSQGEDAQAAAIALGYYVAACDPMVDAFIVRSYQDQSGEAAQGLRFGIKGKKAFTVFQYMDTSKSLSYTEAYLKKNVGSSWKSKVKRYKASRLYKMYRKV